MRVDYLFAVAFLVAPTPKSGATYLLTSVSLRLLGFRQSAVIVSQVVLYCFDKGANISPLQTKLTSSGPSERLPLNGSFQMTTNESFRCFAPITVSLLLFVLIRELCKCGRVVSGAVWELNICVGALP